MSPDTGKHSELNFPEFVVGYVTDENGTGYWYSIYKTVSGYVRATAEQIKDKLRTVYKRALFGGCSLLFHS
jgi:hypothetical protein